MRSQGPSRLVLLQCITTAWTKRSRGAIGASRRNRLPETLPLPANRPGPPGHVLHQTADILYHHVHYDEWNGYQGPYQQYWIAQSSQFPDRTVFWFHGDPRRVFGSVPMTLIRESDTLQIELCWNQVRGAPSRYPKWEPFPGYIKQEKSALALGQWAQVRFNAKSSGTLSKNDSWFYIRYVLNVGYVDTLIPTIFRENQPVQHITDLAYLW